MRYAGSLWIPPNVDIVNQHDDDDDCEHCDCYVLDGDVCCDCGAGEDDDDYA